MDHFAYSALLNGLSGVLSKIDGLVAGSAHAAASNRFLEAVLATFSRWAGF